MRLNVSLGWAFPLVCAAAVWGCADGRPSSSISPVSPSVLTSARAPNSNVTRVTPHFVDRVTPHFVDSDGDGYDDPEPVPMPEPGQPPAPDPGQVPAPDPAQPPVVVTINIVGSFGTAAFAPNPIQASVGNTIVWMNGDVVTHNIVFDDGTAVGNMAPGQSSRPVTLTSATARYHCTIHSSMTGLVIDLAAAPPTAPTEPSQNPPADPSASPEPTDPYDDPYYLRLVP